MCALIMSYSDFLERALQVERAHTHTTSRCEFQDYREILDQGASFINGYSGEYAPAFSNNTIHVASLIIDATMSMVFSVAPAGRV